jgi:hypothetical protein
MRFPAAVISIAVLSASVFAQSNAPAIGGVVTDTSKTPVIGVSIEVKNVDSGNVYKGASGFGGVYAIQQAPPGKYELTASSFGFKTYLRKDIVIQAGQTAKVDVPIGDFISLETLGEDRNGIGLMLLTRPQPPSGPAPRAADGKPDFSGVWYGPLPAGPTETPDLQPWAQAIQKDRMDANLKDSPSARCLPFNLGFLNMFGNRLVQNREMLVSIIEYDIPGYRQIYLDGRSHPKDLETSWTGHSIGKWEGDAMVVETVGLNDKTWLGEAAPHTDKLKITTRLRRTDLGHMEIETTYDDPGALKKPWVVKGVATLAPSGEEIPEFICTENNQDVEHLVGK